jgi:hypothetical protein
VFKTDSYYEQVIKNSMSNIDYIQSLEGDVKNIVVSVYTDSLQKSHCMYNGVYLNTGHEANALFLDLNLGFAMSGFFVSLFVEEVQI